jgi:[ribosomal protein S5]-alanine N-acetyltransferase
VIVTTERLVLHPLPLPLIEAVLAGDVARARDLAPFPLHAGTFADDGYVLALRRDRLRADPTEEPWLYRAAVSRATGEVVGRIGFHAPPDADGTIEVGYSVDPPHRRQGLATEMAAGLIAWGRQHGARRCLGSTAPGNAASQAVLARLGFVRTGEQMDEVDGLEEVFTLELEP